jgi:hypothetical protein
MFIEGLGLEANERANKAALILVHDRYSKQIAPFVKGQAARLSYVEPQIDALIIEASEETNADVQYVKDRFTAFLRESVPSSVPDESTGIRNDTPEGMDEFFKTDVMDRGEVPGLGADEARDDGVEKQDLGDNTLPYDSLQPTAAALIKKAMTAKDFVLIASVLAQNNADPALVDAFADALSHTNEMFSRERFVAAASGSPLSGRDAPREIPIGNHQGIGLNACVRCDAPLSEKIASETDVCASCTRELLAKVKEADASWNNDGDILGPSGTGTAISDPSQQGLVQPAQQDTPFTCTICGQQGSQQDMLTHVQNDHADVLQRMQQQNQPQPGQPMMGAVKEADPAAGDISPAEVQPLPQSPGDRFDSIVQDLAERAAARHFSKPTDADFHTLASQLGVDEQQIRENLIAMAQFGNYAGINGELSDDATPPEGYEPVSLQNGGNNAHRAEVPTDLVVSKVAEDMNLDDNLAQQMIQDHYGGVDLPSVYNANVQGQQLFYLPTDLAGNQQQQTQPQPATDPNVGPAFQQTPPGAPVPAQPGTVPQQ